MTYRFTGGLGDNDNDRQVDAAAPAELAVTIIVERAPHGPLTWEWYDGLVTMDEVRRILEGRQVWQEAVL